MTEEKHKQLFKDIVLRFAQESRCESVKVAAIAVKDGRIIATGINGTLPHSTNCDDYFHQLYYQKKIEISYEMWIKTKDWREIHHAWSEVNEIHGEESLVCEAARRGIVLEGTEIYISHEPCIHCAKTLAALKPQKIFYVNRYDKSDSNSKILIASQSIIIGQI